MIIVHVHRTYWPVLGGCEIAMQRICEELAKMGYEVHVITSNLGTKDRPRNESVNGVYVHRVRTWTLHYPDLAIPREIPRDLLIKADIVQGWSQNSLFTYGVCKEAKKFGKPIVMYFLGVDYLKNHYNLLLRTFGYLYQRWVTKRVVKISDLALVTNKYEKELLRKRYGIDAIVLPHGVDEAYLRLPNIAYKFREKYGIEGRIIAYIGRIHPTKGLDVLIKAFAKVVKQIPDVVLVIAGKGDEKYLKNCLELARRLRVQDKVKYVGYIPEEDKIALIDASEVVVLPTKHAGESYPLIINEVLARGKPIIVTSKSITLKRLATEMETCIVTDCDINALSKVLRDVLQGSLRREVTKESIYVDSNIIGSWSSIAKSLLNIYRNLLEVKNP